MSRIAAMIDLTPTAVFPVIRSECNFVIGVVRNADLHIGIRIAGAEIECKQ